MVSEGLMGKPKGRPVTSDRDDMAVKIDRAVASDARWIAEKKKKISYGGVPDRGDKAHCS